MLRPSMSTGTANVTPCSERGSAQLQASLTLARRRSLSWLKLSRSSCSSRPALLASGLAPLVASCERFTWLLLYWAASRASEDLGLSISCINNAALLLEEEEEEEEEGTAWSRVTSQILSTSSTPASSLDSSSASVRAPACSSYARYLALARAEPALLAPTPPPPASDAALPLPCASSYSSK